MKMQDTRYRINFNLSSLLEDGAVTLNKESEAGFEPSRSLGFESAVENFLEYYNFLPLFNTSFSLVTSLGAVVNVEHAPLKVKTDTNPKGKIIDLQLKNGNTYKFFVADSDIYESRSVIDQLMWGLREIGNKPKEYKLSIKGACHLSEAIGYMIINSDFFDDPIAQWQNGEYDKPHVKEPIVETVGIILTNPIINNIDSPMKVYEEVTRNSDNAVETLNSLVGKLASRSVCPMGVVTIDSNTEWARQLKKLIDTEGSVNLGLGAVRGHLVEVTNIENKRTQTFFVRGDTRQEAGRNLKEYLLVRIGDYNPTLYQKDYKEFTDSTIIAKHILMAINNNNSIDTTEKSKGISTDFMKKD